VDCGWRMPDSRSIAQHWHELLEARRTRRYATLWRVADLLLGQPVVTEATLVERLNVTFPSANTAVGVLVEMDILRQQGPRRR